MAKIKLTLRIKTQVFVIAFALSAAHSASAQDASLEDRVKATFILNFIQFAEWPRVTVPPASSFLICIVGDEFQTVMEETVRGETASNGQPLSVRVLMQAKDAAGCRVIYFRESANRAASQEILNNAKAGPVLTVGEAPEFLSKGGIVRFTRVRNRIHFQINPAAAEKVAISISSRLLRLADIVRLQ